MDGADGDQGPQGPQGITGATGAPGADGLPGSMGPPGLDGEDGSDGRDGEPGPAGPTGATGPAGADGAMGPAGPAGVDGVDGEDGEMGPPGERGADGAAGAMGPPGLDASCECVGDTMGYPLGGGAHHALSGLDDYDDHLLYLKLGGRAGGQTYHGGTASGNNLLARSNTLQDGVMLLGDDESASEYVNVHGPTAAWAATGGNAKLRVVGTTSTGTPSQSIALMNGAFYGPSIFGYAHKGSATARTTLANGDNLLQFAAFGHDGTAFRFAATMGYRVNDTVLGTGGMGSLFFVQTTPE